jgi:hypothetical protein
MQVVVEVVREGSEAGEGRADDNDDDDDDDDEDKDVDEDDDEDDDDEYSGILRNCMRYSGIFYTTAEYFTIVMMTQHILE